MIKYIIKLGILWLMICSPPLAVLAQDFNQTISFADKQFSNKNYQSAVKEYQRALFFSKGQKVDYLYRQIAHSFFANNQFDQAAYFYELSYKTSKNDSLKTETQINKVQCYLLRKKFDQALIELVNIPDSLNQYFDNKKKFYLAITYFGLEKFQDSESYFLSLVANEEQSTKEKIRKLFKKKKNLHRPNPKTAKIMSRILPGAGQIYSGDIKNSLNSLALTGGFVTLGIFMAQEYTYLDAILTSLPWFMRYYKGGYNKAYDIAYNKRAKRRNKTYKEILKTIKETKKNERNQKIPNSSKSD